MTRIDPSRMQALISQKFDNAQAPGQLGGHSVRIIDPPGPRVQPSASGFINKVKSLYDRDIRLQRAEEGVTRGVKSVDKALGKLLDAIKTPMNRGVFDLAKIQRRLEALPGSAKSATSRGADYNELIEARLKLYIGKLDNDQLDKLSTAIQLSFDVLRLTRKSERFENSLLFLDAVFSKELDEREKFQKAGFSADQMVSFRQAGGTSEDIAAFKQAGGKPEDIAAFKNEGFSVGEMTLYAGFSVTEAKSLKAEYQRLGIPVNEKTIVKDFKASNLIGDMAILGEGKINKVYKGTYKMSDGSSYTGVFKEEKIDFQKIYPIGAYFSGIPNALAGGRGMASHALNDLLGFDVIARTAFGMDGDKKLGIVMEMAHGESGLRAKKEIFDDPVVRRELTKLQWLDGLTAQVDRHPDNYFIETDNGGRAKRVIGIDNDLSFGQKITDPNHISKNQKSCFNGLKLPSVIDTEMAKAFEELTPDKIRESLDGLLSKDEIDATVQRLTGIQNHIKELHNKGCVIDPKQWGSDEVGALLSKDTSTKNATSYVARDKYYKPPAINIQPS